MTRWAVLFPLAAALGCSRLDEAEGGVVALELRVPSPATLEVGETLQLSVRPLNSDGDSVAAAVTWLTPGDVVTVDQTGLVTGVAPGTGQVQARVGSLTSGLVSVGVLARADTLIIVGDSIFTVPLGQSVSPALVVRLESFAPVGPVESRPVVYAVVTPVQEVPTRVQLAGGVLVDTLVTAADGTIGTVTLDRVAGVTGPDSAVVEVRATRTRGAAVPGSGQRFIVRFE
ncbi:MAG: Ig-like domain-containing protein [Gemmatimonadales bacterium]